MTRQKGEGQKGEKQTDELSDEQVQHKPREKTEDVEGTKSSIL